jgi:O-antigen/teichoic acid export membrane protein
MSSIHRSIFFSAIERYGSLLLLFLSTAVLSRLLTPQEFGIFAVVNALTTVIAASFQEFGGANYLVQKTDLSEDNVRTAFTVTACISALAAAVLYLFSGKLALLFSQQGLGIGITVSVLNFLLTPFSTTIVALLRRNMDFGALAFCALLGNVAGVAVSIVLALLHYSFLAPIWGAIAGAAVQTLCLVFRQNDLRIFRPSLSGFQDVVGFGLYSGGIVVINIFYNFAPQLFLARILDFTAVGLYSRAVNITQVFDKFVIQALTPVIMPAIFSQIKAGANLKKLYLDAIAMLSVIHWPSLIFVAVMARPIILIWLGPSWLDVVPLIRILCVAYLSLFASCLTYPVLVAAGGVRDALNSSLISLPPSLLLILASSFFGVKAVAASALLTLPFQVAIALYFVCRRLDLSLTDLLRALFKSGMVTLCSSIGVLVCAGLVEHGAIGPLLGLVCACLSMAVCWLAALIAIRHPLLPRLQSAINSLLAAALPVRMGGPAKTLHSGTDVR